MDRVKRFARKSTDIIRNDGVVGFSKRAVKYVYHRSFSDAKKRKSGDILFINGCGLPHPARYRVSHQLEQLRAAGIAADEVYFESLDMSYLNYYKGFVFYRCPVTDVVREFIPEAKKRNKTCFFDVDDLVIDTKYTNQITYVANMSVADKELYDDGVNRMHETMMMCDYAITSTDVLKAELTNYISEVYVNRNVASDEMAACSLRAVEALKDRPSNIFTIGYFSGSITHNADFAIVLPALVELFQKYDNLRLKVGGILDLPTELEPFSDKITATGFIDWRQLPAEIVKCDVNIAPIEDTIFNRAKSENKWLEAGLVAVPTIATNIGAFQDIIKNGQNGILTANDKWFAAIEALVENRQTALTIGKSAQDEVIKNHTTVNSCRGIADFITSRLSQSIAFVLPTSDISGGVNVILKHSEILLKKGWDVTLIDDVDKTALKKANQQYKYRHEMPGQNLFIRYQTDMNTQYDAMVATLWTTLAAVKDYAHTKRRIYLVQGFETDFYQWGTGNVKFDANATYFDRTGVEYITISPWCKEWLKEKYSKDAAYAPNGIDLNNYPVRKRQLKDKIKILIEGDSHTKIKNTDEAFRIVEKLDRSKYHISYLSYHKSPKSWYIVDKFYNRIAPDKVGQVYADCDILIKTSILESFSYPPLEMMATGGYVVALKNDGNKEYLVDGKNCLLYKQGDIEAGVKAVERIVKNSELQNTLYSNGIDVARKYSWSKIEPAVAKLYE